MPDTTVDIDLTKDSSSEDGETEEEEVEEEDKDKEQVDGEGEIVLDVDGEVSSSDAGSEEGEIIDPETKVRVYNHLRVYYYFIEGIQEVINMKLFCVSRKK